MVSIFIIISLILIILISKIIKNKLTKTVVLLYATWTLIILTISSFNLYGENNVSLKIYILWVINITLVILATLLFSNKKDIIFKIDIQVLKKSKKLLIIAIFVFIIFNIFYLRYKNILSNLSIADIRTIRYEKLFNSGLEYILYSYITLPLFHLHLIITAILIANKEYKNGICILGIINLFLESMIGYGRMNIFKFALYILIAYLIIKKGRKENIKFKSIFLGILGITIFTFIGSAITLVRAQGIEFLSLTNIYEYGISEQIKQIIIYFTGGFRALEQLIQSNTVNINSLTLGRASLGGLDECLGSLMNFLGINFITINSTLGAYTQQIINIGDNIIFNAFYTCIMNYYYDFGYFGIILFPIIHGFVIALVINNFQKKQNVVSLILLIYVLCNALCSIYRWEYQFAQNFILLIIIILLNILYEKKYEKGRKIL